jgi:hypothetical protein
MTTPDLNLIRRWLATLAPVPGVHVAAHRKAKSDGGATFPGWPLDLTDLDRAVAQLAETAATTDVYLRTTTAATAPERGRRGGNDDTHALWGLWSDLDHARGLHKANPDGLPLPLDRNAALTILDGLPAPTVVVDSTGGLYAWWLLEVPATVDSHGLATLTAAAQRWGDMLHQRGTDLGWHVDPVKDLARILRPPGTLNHKWTRAGHGAPQLVTIDDHWTSGTRYQLDDLLALCPEPAPAPAPAVTTSGDHADLEAWQAATSWAQILEPYGWRKVRDCGAREGAGTEWTRPGDPDHPRSAVTDHNGTPVMVVHSDNTSLPAGPGQKLTKFRVYAHLAHGGDMAAASAAIRDNWADGPAPAATLIEPIPERPTEQDVSAPVHDSLVRGGTFVLDQPDKIPAVWGRDGDVLAASGEPTYIAGPEGVGKTTIAAQILRGRLGIVAEVLGYPVNDDGRPVLYLAMDRPAQIARAFARLFTRADRRVLDARLVVWRGPLPDLVENDPAQILRLAMQAGAGTVFVDSVKDLTPTVEKPESAGQVNRAFQMCVAKGVEVIALHHPRKANAQNKKPNTLDDLYGGRWLAAGAGSVLSLWGKAGDPIVELSHLKTPVNEVGPLTVIHDHARGLSTVEQGASLLDLLDAAPKGLTAHDAARQMYGTDKPRRADVEKVRRRLEDYHERGWTTVEEVDNGSRGGRPTKRYRTGRVTPVEQTRSNHAAPPGNHEHGDRETSTTPPQTQSQSNHATTQQEQSRNSAIRSMARVLPASPDTYQDCPKCGARTFAVGPCHACQQKEGAA